MKRSLPIVALSALIAFNPAQAEEANTKKLNPWTQCGLGAMIFNGEASGWAAGAAISNIIWDLGTTAVTSNISSQETCSRAKWNTAMFIDENLQDLEQQTAQGYGDHIDSMLDLYECNHTARPEIVSSIRSDLATTISSTQYSSLTHNEKAYTYYASVDTAVSNFASACLAI